MSCHLCSFMFKISKENLFLLLLKMAFFLISSVGCGCSLEFRELFDLLAVFKYIHVYGLIFGNLWVLIHLLYEYSERQSVDDLLA